MCQRPQCCSSVVATGVARMGGAKALLGSARGVGRDSVCVRASLCVSESMCVLLCVCVRVRESECHSAHQRPLCCGSAVATGVARMGGAKALLSSARGVGRDGVCVREGVGESLCVSERVSECVSESLCVCQRECVSERERVCVCDSVCV